MEKGLVDVLVSNNIVSYFGDLYLFEKKLFYNFNKNWNVCPN